MIWPQQRSIDKLIQEYSSASSGKINNNPENDCGVALKYFTKTRFCTCRCITAAPWDIDEIILSTFDVYNFHFQLLHNGYWQWLGTHWWEWQLVGSHQACHGWGRYDWHNRLRLCTVYLVDDGVLGPLLMKKSTTGIKFRAWMFFKNHGTPFLSCLAYGTRHLAFSWLVLLCLVWGKINYSRTRLWLLAKLVELSLHDAVVEYYICMCKVWNSYSNWLKHYEIHPPPPPPPPPK